ncbi:MAG: pectinesterase family protein [Phycisphaerae bacterium]|jgi:hypothetical protein
MNKKSLSSRNVCFIILLAMLIFACAPDTKATDMTISSFIPANNSIEICADTKLWITFTTVPAVATSGNLQICKVSDDSVVYQLDLQTLPYDIHGWIATGWPYQINLNGLTLNYVPFAVSGNTLEIYPSTRLEYNTSYYVKITAGFCTDSGSNTSPAITDNTTWRFTTKASTPAADRNYIVALDGTGDFCTLQGATDAAADNDPCRTVIGIKNGTYREIVHIPASKTNITWIGENKDATIVAGYNRELFNPGSDYRMMVKAFGSGFRMYNLTLQNTAPDNSGQAETITPAALKCVANNCKFLSYQDTLLIKAGGQVYFKDCFIQGDTDFIWGYGTAYFDKCQMNEVTSNAYIMQPRTPDGVNGFFLVDCNLTVPRGVRNCYFGRLFDGHGYAQVVMLNCAYPGSIFYPVGWYQNTLTDLTNLRLWEYKSVDIYTGEPANIASRLTPGTRQLTDAEAITWRDVNNVFSANPWNPKSLEPPTASWLPVPADGAADINSAGISLTWTTGATAVSHRVYFGTTNPPEFVTEQTGTSMATGAMSLDTTYYWRVDEKNTAGVTTGAVWSFTTQKYVCNGPMPFDLNGDCQVNLFDYIIMANAWAGDWLDMQQLAENWLMCNRNPSGQCWQ